MIKSKVSVVECADYNSADVERAVREAIGLLGGITNFIKPKSRVLLKPNLLMAIEPQRAITTHPEIIRAIIHILKDIDAQICIGDNPSVFGKSEDLVISDVYHKTGIAKVAEEEGVKLVELKQKNFKRSIPLTGVLDEVDAVINIPKFKTHGFMVLTGAIKNLFGLIPGLSKTEMHKAYFKPEEFARMLVDIYASAKPALNIVDAIDVLEGDGPGTSGDKRHIGLVLAGPDAVAVDSVLARLANVAPKNVPVIADAFARGLGNSDLNSVEILGVDLAGVIIPGFKLPQPSLAHKIPPLVFNFIKRFLDYRPKINPKICIRCKKCQGICPKQVITITEPPRNNEYIGGLGLSLMQGATTKAYPMRYAEEKQRSSKPKICLPFGVGLFWAATASLVLGVALWLRRRPRFLSRSKIVTANVPIISRRLSKPKIDIDYSGCIRCFCCQEVCPERAISIRKSLLAKILGIRG